MAFVVYFLFFEGQLLTLYIDLFRSDEKPQIIGGFSKLFI
jgi:hypothetical protein